jgi:hypothetical protein
MGREAVHWSFTAYILLNDRKLNRGPGAVYGSMIVQRNALIQALEQDGPGDLVHPSLSTSYDGGQQGASVGGVMLAMCERYSISESRQKGGYYEFDMQFVEAGAPPLNPAVDTRGLLLAGATAMNQAAKDQLKAQLISGSQQLPGSRPGSPVGPLALAGPAAIRKFQ